MYKVDADGKLIRFRNLGQEEPVTEFYSGLGGLRSSIVGYFRFAQCLLNGGELDGVRILSSESVQMMTSNQTEGGALNDKLGWGFGVSVWLKDAPDRLGKKSAYGWNGGTGTMYIVDPIEKLIAIIFIPSQPRTPVVDGLGNHFVKAAYEAIVESYR